MQLRVGRVKGAVEGRGVVRKARPAECLVEGMREEGQTCRVSRRGNARHVGTRMMAKLYCRVSCGGKARPRRDPRRKRDL